MMTTRFVGLWCLAVVLILLGAWAFSGSRVNAAEPTCYTIDDAVAALDGMDGEMLDMIDIPGETIDQLLFANVGGAVQMWGAKAGCMVGQPIPVDMVKKAGTPV